MALIELPSSDNFPDSPALYVVAQSMLRQVELLADVDVGQREPFKSHLACLKELLELISHDCIYIDVLPF